MNYFSNKGLTASSLLAAILLLAQLVSAQENKGFRLNNAQVPLEEIRDGGPPKDGIPAIDHPKFLMASESVLDDNNRVLGVFFKGVAKAYPINILNYHEIVNDFFGPDPVVITYCPLCGSGIAFDARIGGSDMTFGVSGLLYNSDVLLYDRQTASLWSQLLAKSISGPLAGEPLTMIPTENTSWGTWKEVYPGTLVLSEATGYEREYGKNPYPGYEDSRAIYFPVSNQSGLFHPKETIIGLELDGRFKAYPFSELKKAAGKEIVDQFQGRYLRILYNMRDQSARILDQAGDPVTAITNYWFAWYAFHPETEVYRHPQKNP